MGTLSSNLLLHVTFIPSIVTLASHRRAAAGLTLDKARWAVTKESHELAALVEGLKWPLRGAGGKVVFCAPTIASPTILLAMKA